MIHPDTELRFISKEKGYGVFATKFIPKGTVIYVADKLDIFIKPNSPLLKDSRYLPIIEKFTFIDSQGTRILSWDHAKYVNHCCQPNSLTTGWGFEIAVTDIQPNDEITDDYGVFTTEHEMTISCSKKACRLKLSGDDFDRCVPAWDKKLQSAFRTFMSVDQPMKFLLSTKVVEDVEAYLDGSGKYLSVAEQKPISKRKGPVVDIRQAKNYRTATETG